MLLSFLFLFAGCIKEDLSVCRNRVQFEIKAIWPEGSRKPTGIRTAIYLVNNKSYVLDNFPPEGGVLNINPGTYSVLVHNNDNTTVSFRNIKKYETYEAHTKTLNIPSYKPPVPNEDLVAQPDILWATNVERHDVLSHHTILVYPQQIVKRYIFKLFNIKGIENVRAVRGSLSGMMGSYYLNPNITPAQASTVFFDQANVNTGITFDILSFGVIIDLSEEGGVKHMQHTLTVEIMNQSEVHRYNIDVTERLDAIAQGGEIDIYSEIEVPKGEGGGGGFEGEIGDWDNVIVPLE